MKTVCESGLNRVKFCVLCSKVQELLSSDCSIMDIRSPRTRQKCSRGCVHWEALSAAVTSVIALSSRAGLMYLSCWLLISAAWQRRDRPDQVFLAISAAAMAGRAEVHRPDSPSATQPQSVSTPLRLQSSAAKCLFFLLKKMSLSLEYSTKKAN